VRKIEVYEAPCAGFIQAIEATLQQDLLSTSCREGGMWLGKQIVVT
jgi:hypothetical protein